MPSVNVTDKQKTQADSARTELSDMLLHGVTSPSSGNITAPFLGLTGVPATALDLYEAVHLAALRLFSAFSAFDNVTASYPHTSASFTTKGGSLLVSISASAFADATGMLGIDIKIDGNTVGTVEQYGAISDHKMLSRLLLVPNIAAGNHTLGASLRVNTSADSNDRISAVVVELPF